MFSCKITPIKTTSLAPFNCPGTATPRQQTHSCPTEVKDKISLIKFKTNCCKMLLNPVFRNPFLYCAVPACLLILNFNLELARHSPLVTLVSTPLLFSVCCLVCGGVVYSRSECWRVRILLAKLLSAWSWYEILFGTFGGVWSTGARHAKNEVRLFHNGNFWQA